MDHTRSPTRRVHHRRDSEAAAAAAVAAAAVTTTADDDGTPPPDDLPACLSCRKRKSRCSRARPSCSQCLRLGCECLYVSRQKPGLKTGVVDSLSRRLDVLEKLFLDSSGHRKPHLAFLDLDIEVLRSQPFTPQILSEQYASRAALAGSGVASTEANTNDRRKRRRLDDRGADDEDSDTTTSSSSSSSDDDDSPPLPPLPLLEAVVEAHFQSVHHWVPILHPVRFRAQLRNAAERHRLAVLPHAVLALSIKYVDFGALGLTARRVRRQIRESRRAVRLHATGDLSLASTQALVFLAFDYLGSGLVARAWPIVAALTRTVVCMQLAVEDDDEVEVGNKEDNNNQPRRRLRRRPLLDPLIVVDRPRDWTEAESQRRIFWAVFLLDRFCSVSAGWHANLTASEVHRRLPCSGGFWAREEPATTPYFGLWDRPKSGGSGSGGGGGGGIGGGISSGSSSGSGSGSGSTAASSSSSSSAMAQPNPSPQQPPLDRLGHADKLGAVAYCIEATEQLSRVNSLFLKQAVDLEDRGAFNSWLTRFKELDLRLVHWKMDLPQQWSDTQAALKIDPNLTLSHMSHYTSLILLHQHVAYPPAGWKDAVRLPSSCSADTCQTAAADVAAMAQKYLRYVGGIASSQFSFCLFVAARFLLVHWRAGELANDGMADSMADDMADGLASDFFTLLDCLDNVSARWNGNVAPRRAPGHANPPPPPRDLAAQYAARLRDLYEHCIHDAWTAADMVQVLSTSSLDGLAGRPSTMTATMATATATTTGTIASTSTSSSPDCVDSVRGYGVNGFRQQQQQNRRRHHRYHPRPRHTLRSPRLDVVSVGPVGAISNVGVGSTHLVGSGGPTPPPAVQPRPPLLPRLPPQLALGPRPADLPNLPADDLGGLLDMSLGGTPTQTSPPQLPQLPPSSPTAAPPPQPPSIVDDDLMPHMLLGSQFLDMDRVMMRGDATEYLMRCE